MARSAPVDLDVSSPGFLSLGCSCGTPAVSATLGPAAVSSPGTLVATQSMPKPTPDQWKWSRVSRRRQGRLLAQMGSADWLRNCLLSGVDRK